MTRAGWLPSGLNKEGRALFPVWVSCMTALAASAVTGQYEYLALLASGFGAIALGAHSIGHEYTHRTLGLLLSQPADRRRLFLTKAAVLMSMLLTLCAVALVVLLNQPPLSFNGTAFLFLTALCGLCLAPCLTMLSRNPLAGVVFTIVFPGALLVLGEVLGVAKYGFNGGRDVDAFRLAVFWRGMFVICAAAAVLSWRLFMRLEAIEGRGPELRLPEWLRVRSSPVAEPSARRRHPLWLLAKKELHLQLLSFVVVALYVMVWLALSITQYLVPEVPENTLALIAGLYLTVLAILAGSLASAEERQLGTLEWHMLLPMAASRQWIVKAGLALGLVALFGVGLPALLTLIHTSGEHSNLSGRVLGQTALIAVLLTTISLYVSSLSGSGVRAMVVALAVLVGTVAFMQMAVSGVAWAFHLLHLELGVVALPRGLRGGRAIEYVSLAIAAGFVVVVLRFASVNHRSAEWGFRRIGGQAFWIAGTLTLGLVVLETLARGR